MDRSKNQQLSRRRFLGLTAAAAAFTFVPGFPVSAADANKPKIIKPNSRFGGVQVGAISYSWRGMSPTAEDTLKYCLACGISSVELMSNTAELFAGMPQSPGRPLRDATNEQKAEYQKAVQETFLAQKNWRKSVSMDKFTELRKMYKSAGVKIHIAKFSPENWSDEEIDYAFRASKAMGAMGVSTEIGDLSAQKLGPFAQKYGQKVVLHQHMQSGQEGWTFEKFLDMSPANMLNFDTGHYFGSTGLHPNGIIEKLHDRIASIHIKDKTGKTGTPSNTNMEWGKGETPIADILLLIKKNRWPINVDIELEYPVPEGSDAVTEVKKCVEYCRKILI